MLSGESLRTLYNVMIRFIPEYDPLPGRGHITAHCDIITARTIGRCRKNG
jgi:hypothetical protein